MFRRLGFLAIVALTASATVFTASGAADPEYHDVFAGTTQEVDATWVVPVSSRMERIYDVGAWRNVGVENSSDGAMPHPSVTVAYAGTALCPNAG